MDRAFLMEPWPADRCQLPPTHRRKGARLNLIAQEIARLALSVLTEWSAAVRKLKDSKAPKDVHDDIQAQLQRLMPPRFIAITPHAQLQHFPVI